MIGVKLFMTTTELNILGKIIRPTRLTINNIRSQIKATVGNIQHPRRWVMHYCVHLLIWRWLKFKLKTEYCYPMLLVSIPRLETKPHWRNFRPDWKRLTIHHFDLTNDITIMDKKWKHASLSLSNSAMMTNYYIGKAPIAVFRPSSLKITRGFVFSKKNLEIIWYTGLPFHFLSLFVSLPSE